MKKLLGTIITCWLLTASVILVAQTTGTGPLDYPLSAKAAGIEGTVVVKGTIGIDGKIHDLRAIGGPKELRQAGIDTVAHYPYHPYTHDGKPVEVETTVKVVFTMGNKEQKAAAQAAAKAQLTAQSTRTTANDATNPKL